MALKVYNVPLHSEEWYAFRSVGTKDYVGGTGASEIAIVCEVDEKMYRPTTMEIFHQKVGTAPIMRFDNERMAHGRNTESYIGRCWEYWDGKEQFAINLSNDTPVRKKRRRNGYLTNSDYPYLFTSLDFEAIKGTPCLMDINTPNYKAMAGEMMDNFPVECKQISTDAFRHYANNLPDNYIVQLQIQMLIMDSYYGELAVLVGGNDFHVYSYERNDYICQKLYEKNKAFWEERVLPARELYRLYIETGKEEYLADIESKYEPMPNDSAGYKSYLSERHKTEYTEAKGTKEQYEYLLKLKDIISINKGVSAIEEEMRNNVRYWLVQEKAEVINFEDFDKAGYVKYLTKQGRETKELSLRGFRPKPDTDIIDEALDKIKGVLKKYNIQ